MYYFVKKFLPDITWWIIDIWYSVKKEHEKQGFNLKETENSVKWFLISYQKMGIS